MSIASVFYNRFSCLDLLWVDSMARSGHDSVETIVIISGVMDGSDGTIRFHHGVRALDYISITFFFLRFMITGVSVTNAIVEFVFWIGLLN